MRSGACAGSAQPSYRSRAACFFGGSVMRGSVRWRPSRALCPAWHPAHGWRRAVDARAANGMILKPERQGMRRIIRDAMNGRVL